MVKRSYCRWVAIALLAGATAARCTRNPSPAYPKPQNIDQLRAAIGDVLRKHGVPGVGFALVSKDRVLFAGGVGKADIGANRDVTADTMFRIGIDHQGLRGAGSP